MWPPPTLSPPCYKYEDEHIVCLDVSSVDIDAQGNGTEETHKHTFETE